VGLKQGELLRYWKVAPLLHRMTLYSRNSYLNKRVPKIRYKFKIISFLGIYILMPSL